MDRPVALAAYERAWSGCQESEVRADLERCWTTQSTYLNPLTDTVSGIDGMTNLILDFPVMFPEATLERTSEPDIHHDVARFAWRLRSTARIRMLGKDYGFSVEGVDYVEFDQENRIRRVVGFFGPLHHRASLDTEGTGQPQSSRSESSGQRWTTPWSPRRAGRDHDFGSTPSMSSGVGVDA